MVQPVKDVVNESELGKFFDDIGLSGFVVNDDGRWKNVTNAELDSEVINHDNYGLPFRLLVDPRNGLLDVYARFPSYKKGSLTYRFVYATYREGQMHVMCDVSSEYQHMYEAELTLDELRARGINKPEGWRGWLVHLNRLFRSPV